MPSPGVITPRFYYRLATQREGCGRKMALPDRTGPVYGFAAWHLSGNPTFTALVGNNEWPKATPWAIVSAAKTFYCSGYCSGCTSIFKSAVVDSPGRMVTLSA
jgi:hypothetical protein